MEALASLICPPGVPAAWDPAGSMEVIPVSIVRDRAAFDAMYGADSLTYQTVVGLQIRSVDFRGKNLRGTIFEACDMEDANFRNVDLQIANFTRCDLSFVYFDGADVRGVGLETCSLYQSSWDGARITLSNHRHIQAVLSYAYDRTRQSPPEYEAIREFIAQVGGYDWRCWDSWARDFGRNDTPASVQAWLRDVTAQHWPELHSRIVRILSQEARERPPFYSLMSDAAYSGEDDSEYAEDQSDELDAEDEEDLDHEDLSHEEYDPEE